MALVRRFLRSRKGNIAIISALMMPAIVGFCGLAGETAYWYYRHRDIQGAADLGAFGGAAVLRSGGSSTAITSAATADAVTNGWRQANGSIQVNSPPTSGSWQNQQSVQVVLTENQTRYFSKLFNGAGTVPISVRSTATVLAAGKACILGLNTSAANTVWFQGNATSTLTNCNVATNSSNALGFMQSGSSTAFMPCAYSSGGEQHTAGLHLTSCGAVVQHHPVTPDPYANVPEPSVAGCAAAPVTAPALIVNIPNTTGVTCFNANVDFKGTVNFAPGVYVINSGAANPLIFNSGANITGTGVTFYLANTTIQINGTSHSTLTAPTSGTYHGLLFFGSRNLPASNNNVLNGNATTLMTGAAYFPTQHIDFLGNFTGAGGCMQVVADTIKYTGSGTFASTCPGTGQNDIVVYGNISLVE
jgi:Flp pilus assembly protein TadG